ncbi:MAG TPA: ethanolamine ammonia-lyase subunit EutC [Myxococcota bacterium]|nr:ethanolamine ammonia-lyase subunit EutC [Myxococcota bacterium]
MNFDKYRRYTQARIGLGNSGPAIPTKAWLEFSLHHAAAIDAIYYPWDLEQQKKELKHLSCRLCVLNSKIADREQFLLRPDLGRVLHEQSKKELKKLNNDIIILATNGLSSYAVKNHLAPFLSTLLPLLPNKDPMIALVPNGRVALIDEIGEIIKPQIGITIIGERPGLSSPDSLAAYLTYEPKNGRVDAERNCISNIRPPYGLSYEEAALKLCYLINESLRRKLSGVTLKDETLKKEIKPSS